MSPHASGLFATRIYAVGVGIFAVATLLMRSPNPAQIVEQDFSLFDSRVTSGGDGYLYDPTTFANRQTRKLPPHQFWCGDSLCQMNGGWAR